MTLRVLVNATTCVVGGAIQVATGFISQALHDCRDVSFRFAVSSQVMRNLDESVRRDTRVHELSPSPARPWRGRGTRRALRSLAREYQPDVAFTVFGPAYCRFDALHVCGLADPWITHRSKIALSVLSPLRRRHYAAIRKYKQWWLSPKDYYWVETEVARRGLVKLLRIDPARIRIIPNGYAGVFGQMAREAPPREADGIVRVFCLAAPYPHKNLSIIPEVARLLRDNHGDRPYRFIVTLPEAGRQVQEFWAKARHLGVMSMIENVGYLPLKECPRWYARSDIVFLPTLLETFSVTYLEAMLMGRPIVTTDLDFAHDICGDAAAYYSPLSAEDAAEAIRSVAADGDLRAALARQGYARLQHFPSPQEKYRRTLQWIYEVAGVAHRGL